MRTVKGLALLILICPVASCAVLTIDVDVYKGPLANDESVQVQQATVMAMGAKPLLISLRDKLESEKRQREFRALPNYQAGYINPQTLGQELTVGNFPRVYQKVIDRVEKKLAPYLALEADASIKAIQIHISRSKSWPSEQNIADLEQSVRFGEFTLADKPVTDKEKILNALRDAQMMLHAARRENPRIKGFRSELAARVNEILSLYIDIADFDESSAQSQQASAEIQLFVSKCSQLIKKYRTALKTLIPDKNETHFLAFIKSRKRKGDSLIESVFLERIRESVTLLLGDVETPYRAGLEELILTYADYLTFKMCQPNRDSDSSDIWKKRYLEISEFLPSSSNYSIFTQFEQHICELINLTITPPLKEEFVVLFSIVQLNQWALSQFPKTNTASPTRDALVNFLNKVEVEYEKWQKHRSTQQFLTNTKSFLHSEEIRKVRYNEIKKLSANRKFKLLRSPVIIDSILTVLSEGTTKSVSDSMASMEKERLKQKIVSIGKAFESSRTDLSKLFNLAIDQLIRLGELSYRKLNPKEQIKLRKIVSDVVIELIDKRYLVAALNNRDSPATTLVTLLKKEEEFESNYFTKTRYVKRPKHHKDASQNWTATDSKKIENALRRYLWDPILSPRIAKELSQLNLYFQNIDPKKVTVEERNYDLTPKIKRRFGIVEGPFKKRAGNQTPTASYGGFEETFGTVLNLDISGSLAGGRLADGIERLIENFLKKGPKKNSISFDETKNELPNSLRDEELNKLLDALVRFAQKVLALGNFQKILPSESAIHFPNSFGKLEISDENRSYIDLLQTIGNALLSQINELRVYERYRQKLKKESVNGSNHLEALKAEGILNGIDIKSGGSKEILDKLISRLRFEHLQALTKYGHGSVEELKIRATIEAAHDHRSGMVYIRPASFYLRNSFLFSSQQGHTKNLKRNMLDEEALKGLPFVTNLLNPKLNNEFDSQYWQNINRVKLTGTGFTNYVVAKDDVGNWSVKDYSSDPKDIIAAAKSLALFSAGGTIEASAVNKAAKRIENKPSDVNLSPESNPNADYSVVGKQLSKIETNHVEATDVLLNDLKKQIDSTPNRLMNSWRDALSASKAISVPDSAKATQGIMHLLAASTSFGSGKKALYESDKLVKSTASQRNNSKDRQELLIRQSKSLPESIIESVNILQQLVKTRLNEIKSRTTNDEKLIEAWWADSFEQSMNVEAFQEDIIKNNLAKRNAQIGIADQAEIKRDVYTKRIEELKSEQDSIDDATKQAEIGVSIAKLIKIRDSESEKYLVARSNILVLEKSVLRANLKLNAKRNRDLQRSKLLIKSNALSALLREQQEVEKANSKLQKDIQAIDADIAKQIEIVDVPALELKQSNLQKTKQKLDGELVDLTARKTEFTNKILSEEKKISSAELIIGSGAGDDEIARAKAARENAVKSKSSLQTELNAVTKQILARNKELAQTEKDLSSIGKQLGEEKAKEVTDRIKRLNDARVPLFQDKQKTDSALKTLGVEILKTQDEINLIELDIEKQNDLLDESKSDLEKYNESNKNRVFDAIFDSANLDLLAETSGTVNAKLIASILERREKQLLDFKRKVKSIAAAFDDD